MDLIRTQMDELQTVPDRTSPPVSGYFRIPAVWIDSKPDASSTNYYETVFRAALVCGIPVRVQRNGFFVFDFTNWRHAPAVVIPGFTSKNGTPGPKAHYLSEARAAEYIVLRSKVMNVHQACFTTAEALLGGGSMMGHPVNSRELHAALDFEAPQYYQLPSVYPRPIAEAVLDNAYGVRFESRLRRHLVKVALIERSFQLLDEILCRDDPRLIELINNYYVAAIRARETHYGEALVLAWGVCEQLLSLAWTMYLDGIKSSTAERMSKDRRKKLDGRDYTASVVIETLELQGQLDRELYRHLETARKARNRWAHELAQPTFGELHSCMVAAQLMLTRFLNITIRLQHAAEPGSFPSWSLPSIDRGDGAAQANERK